jgi:hypothetical protein
MGKAMATTKPATQGFYRLTEPTRPEGFYWVEKDGEVFPAQYANYASEEVEEKYFADHPDAEADWPVLSYGWILDFDPLSEPKVFQDSAFTKIGPMIERQEALESKLMACADNLLAAAPNLLTALKDLSFQYSGRNKDKSCGHEFDCACAWANAKAAIAKAEGK